MRLSASWRATHGFPSLWLLDLGSFDIVSSSTTLRIDRPLGSVSPRLAASIRLIASGVYRSTYPAKGVRLFVKAQQPHAKGRLAVVIKRWRFIRGINKPCLSIVYCVEATRRKRCFGIVPPIDHDQTDSRHNRDGKMTPITIPRCRSIASHTHCEPCSVAGNFFGLNRPGSNPRLPRRVGLNFAVDLSRTVSSAGQLFNVIVDIEIAKRASAPRHASLGGRAATEIRRLRRPSTSGRRDD